MSDPQVEVLEIFGDDSKLHASASVVVAGVDSEVRGDDLASWVWYVTHYS